MSRTRRSSIFARRMTSSNASASSVPSPRDRRGDQPRAMREVADLRRLQPLLVLAEEQHAGHGQEDEDDVEREEADGEAGGALRIEN